MKLMDGVLIYTVIVNKDKFWLVKKKEIVRDMFKSWPMYGTDDNIHLRRESNGRTRAAFFIIFVIFTFFLPVPL